MVNKFIFTVPEIYHSTREVIASTYEEAVELLNNGDYWDSNFLAFQKDLEPIKFETVKASDEEIKYWSDKRNDIKASNTEED